VTDNHGDFSDYVGGYMVLQGLIKIYRTQLILGKVGHLQIALTCLLQRRALQIVFIDYTSPYTVQCMCGSPTGTDGGHL
jgi:hypothetical protein